MVDRITPATEPHHIDFIKAQYVIQSRITHMIGPTYVLAS